MTSVVGFHDWWKQLKCKSWITKAEFGNETYLPSHHMDKAEIVPKLHQKPECIRNTMQNYFQIPKRQQYYLAPKFQNWIEE